VRRQLGLDRYKATPEEVSRFIEELRLYERSVGRFQYHIPDEELKKAFDYLTVECTGTESDPIEVSSYRNLPRVETTSPRRRPKGGERWHSGTRPQSLHNHRETGVPRWDWLKEFKKKTEEKKIRRLHGRRHRRPARFSLFPVDAALQTQVR